MKTKFIPNPKRKPSGLTDPVSPPFMGLPDRASPPPDGWVPIHPARLRKPGNAPGLTSMREAFLFVLGLHVVAVSGIVLANMGQYFLLSLGIVGILTMGCVSAAKCFWRAFRFLVSLWTGHRQRFRSFIPNPVPHRRLSPAEGREKLKEDLHFVFRFFPRQSLIHLRHQFHRLSHGSFTRPDGSGCLFNILSENLSRSKRIVSQETLARFFTGGSRKSHRELPAYQPARFLVKAFDQKRLARYGGITLDREILWEAVEEALLEPKASGSPRLPKEAGQPDYEC